MYCLGIYYVLFCIQLSSVPTICILWWNGLLKFVLNWYLQKKNFSCTRLKVSSFGNVHFKPLKSWLGTIYTPGKKNPIRARCALPFWFSSPTWVPWFSSWFVSYLVFCFDSVVARIKALMCFFFCFLLDCHAFGATSFGKPLDRTWQINSRSV